MTAKAGRHQLTGVVSFGQYNNDMQKIKTGKTIFEYKITSFIDRLCLQNILRSFVFSRDQFC